MPGKCFDICGLIYRFGKLADNINMSYSERKNMVNPFLCFCLEKEVIDIVKFGEWMEVKYPEYKEKSIEQFLMDKDPKHIKEWKEILGVE